jgi:hypothetical protein
MVTKDRLSVGKNNRDLVLPDDWTICPDLKEKAARKRRCRLRNLLMLHLKTPFGGDRAGRASQANQKKITL